MQKVLRCDCGFEVHADDDADLVVEVQRHALDAHGMHFTPEEVMQLASRAELGARSCQQRLGDDAREDASRRARPQGVAE
jgi:predicted small metal-binding protein